MLFTTSALLALLPFVVAQTSTSCDPTKKSCPADPGYNVATTTYNFQQSAPGDDWTVLGSGDKISQDGNGLHFTIDAEGQAPTLSSKSIAIHSCKKLMHRVHSIRKNHCNPGSCYWCRYRVCFHSSIRRS